MWQTLMSLEPSCLLQRRIYKMVDNGRIRNQLTYESSNATGGLKSWCISTSQVRRTIPLVGEMVRDSCKSWYGNRVPGLPVTEPYLMFILTWARPQVCTWRCRFSWPGSVRWTKVLATQLCGYFLFTCRVCRLVKGRWQPEGLSSLA